MAVYAHLSVEEIHRLVSRFVPTVQKMEAIAFFCGQQVKTRFETRGTSGGAPWRAPKWTTTVGFDDGRSILTGPTGDLLSRFHSYGTETEAITGNDAKYARVQQLGTKGKGGVLPDIVPKRAKALFIPLTDRARTSTPVTARGMKRLATRGPKDKSGRYNDLIQGHFVNGKIEPKNADFVLLKKISIPARPMLPDSVNERADQTEFVIDTLKSDTL